MPKQRARASRASSVLVLGTRGLKARHRHLMRDLLRMLPHGIPGSKLDTEDNSLAGVVGACEDADCNTAMLFDARDPSRLFLWLASCPEGPSAMFRVRNVHTVSELNLPARRCAGVRNLLSFDATFEASPDRRLLKALLTRALSVPKGSAQRVAAASTGGEDVEEPEVEEEGDEEKEEEEGAEEEDAAGEYAAPAAAASGPAVGVERVKHAFTFSWVDDRVWMRVFRIGPDDATGAIDASEIGPRLVLEPVRIIAAAFGGAVLHSHQSQSLEELADEEEMR